MFNPKKYTEIKAKPLPVILMLDISGSMCGSKINQLNIAVRDLLESFRNSSTYDTEIQLSIITYAWDAISIPEDGTLLPAKEFEFERELMAGGMTSMGAALTKAKIMVENRDVIPSRAYRPTIVLVTDGQPNDDFVGPMEDFINHGRSSKCDRMALAIGADADKELLKDFIDGTGNQLFEASDASQIIEFFKRVTMSVAVKSKSVNQKMLESPNKEIRK
jgi:uncharacterized protein YegL